MKELIEFATKEQEIEAKKSFTVNDNASKLGNIVMCIGDEEFIRMQPDGGFYVKGKLVENDREVYEGFRYYFRATMSNNRAIGTLEKDEKGFLMRFDQSDLDELVGKKVYAYLVDV